METSKFLSFYSRELNRIKNINTQYKATREQNLEYTFQGERMQTQTDKPFDLTEILSSIEVINPQNNQPTSEKNHMDNKVKEPVETPDGVHYIERVNHHHKKERQNPNEPTDDDKYKQDNFNHPDIDFSTHLPSSYTRLRFSLQKLQRDYLDCGADNLDYIDQKRMKKFLNSLTHELAKVEHDQEYCSKEVIEELIVLGNLYLGTQIINYPAFLRLAKKQYIEKYVIPREETLDFKIIDFDQSLITLQELESLYRVQTRYEKESNKIFTYSQGQGRKYKNSDYSLPYEERENNLKNNVSELLKKVKRNGLVVSYVREKVEKHSTLIEYLEDMLYVIEGTQPYDIDILEMMIEIANILCDMPVRNPYAFKKIQDQSYFQEHLFGVDEIHVLTYDETYKRLSSFGKKM